MAETTFEVVQGYPVPLYQRKRTISHWSSIFTANFVYRRIYAVARCFYVCLSVPLSRALQYL